VRGRIVGCHGPSAVSRAPANFFPIFFRAARRFPVAQARAVKCFTFNA
jgi:hypothetical protein